LGRFFSLFWFKNVVVEKTKWKVFTVHSGGSSLPFKVCGWTTRDIDPIEEETGRLSSGFYNNALYYMTQWSSQYSEQSTQLYF